MIACNLFEQPLQNTKGPIVEEFAACICELQLVPLLGRAKSAFCVREFIIISTQNFPRQPSRCFLPLFSLESLLPVERVEEIMSQIFLFIIVLFLVRSGRGPPRQ